MSINGAILVGREDRQSQTRFRSICPGTDEPSLHDFSEAGAADVGDACALAEAAAATFGALKPELRAAFLEAVAENIAGIGDLLIETAMIESGLPLARLQGERGRTIGQLRLFAQEVRRGLWLDVVVDPALPERTPPRGDLRRMNVALGPVAIFGASNFPLAFSVAGGDTASAFAAGCPVVVKGHPAHPGTGELVARAIRAAVQRCGLPDGVFSYLPGTAHTLGAALVSDARIKAVGFTGSRAGGLALVEIASKRSEPIPVYAEMSSINPVVLMPQALDSRAEALGEAFVGSLTMGAGQFCTNPGLVLAIDSPALDRFVAAAAAALPAVVPPVMLTPGIHAAYVAGTEALVGEDGVTCVARGQESAGPNRCSPALFETMAASLIANPKQSEEIFGAASLIVRCRDLAELKAVLLSLEGQLTATLQIDEGDADAAREVMPLLVKVAGRVLANGWPTGVEVTHAMVHGGPFPATSAPATTSVGTLAMRRFLRPVCYQDIPDALLPPALQAANPWSLPRSIDGQAPA